MFKSKKLDALEEKYLGPNLKVLIALINLSNEREFIFLRELRESLNKSYQSMSNILNRLEADDLLRRTPTRPKKVYLTKLGRQLLRRIEDLVFRI